MEPLVCLTMLGAVESTPNISYMYISDEIELKFHENWISTRFQPIFEFELKWKSELKILQLGPITNI